MKKLQRQQPSDTIDCACVIHGDAYDWVYVERLYSMLQRNLTRAVNFHVFTEASRPVPAPMIKHVLDEWVGISGPKRSWWYKIQMFDHHKFAGRLLYLDLDTVITGNLDYLTDLDMQYFWGLRDFRHFWRPSWQGLNSSVMLWDTVRWQWVWTDFCSKNIAATVRLHHGDQDYLSAVLPRQDIRFLPGELIKSWRWQILDGGLNFDTRIYRRPGAGSVLDPQTRIMVFHGHPKPHEINDPVLEQHWR